jgi:cytochrome c
VRAALAAALLAGAVATGTGRAGDPERGRRVFERCQACHALRADERGLPGPRLAGLWGRPAAAVPGFDYSPALVRAARERGLVWTEAALDAFLADPGGYVPGNWMGGAGVPDPGDRSDLLAYLRRLTR